MPNVLRLFIVAWLLAVAGCVEPAEEGEADISPTPTPDPGPSQAGEVFTPIESRNQTPLLRPFNQSFDLTLSEAHTLGRSNFDENCVTVRGAPFQMTNLTLVLTWVPQGPLDETLELAVVEFSGDYNQRFAGTSPLTVILDAPLPTADAGDGDQPDEFFAIAAQLAEPGVVWQGSATLDVQFNYLADGDLDVGLGSCALG